MTFTDPVVINDVLKPAEYAALRERLKNTSFRPMQKENGTFLYVLPILHTELDDQLTRIASAHWGRKLEPLLSFARLNTSVHDVDFRVHADSRVVRTLPDVAAIYYLDTIPETGTAFFEHPDYGRTPRDESLNLFTKDDGKWTPYYHYEQVANSMLVYPSQLYHGRYPWVMPGSSAQDGRIVIVKFLKNV